MYKSDGLKTKYLREITGVILKFRAKAKSLRQAQKLLKGQNKLVARITLQEELNRIKFEIQSLGELEENLNRFEE